MIHSIDASTDASSRIDAPLGLILISITNTNSENMARMAPREAQGRPRASPRHPQGTILGRFGIDCAHQNTIYTYICIYVCLYIRCVYMYQDFHGLPNQSYVSFQIFRYLLRCFFNILWHCFNVFGHAKLSQNRTKIVSSGCLGEPPGPPWGLPGGRPGTFSDATENERKK